LQFDESSVRRILDHEHRLNTFASIQLAEVTYGIDRAAPEYIRLARELALRFQRFLYQQYQDGRLAPDGSDMQPDSIFLRSIMQFCATHKDPAFRDEREVRIFAYPTNTTLVQPFFGVTTPKTIWRRDNRPNGARYINIGESLMPGFVPKRFIIGPKAETPVHFLQALYPFMPSFARSTIPIA
jgi:hypothetical protein